MDLIPLAHRLGIITITDLECALLKQIAAHPNRMIGGTAARTAEAQRCRKLAGRGLVRYLNSDQGRWPAGMWAAYPTCNGLNAMWRHAGDTHVAGCAAPWKPDGTCTGCRDRRLLDLPAYETYIAALPPQDRTNELAVSALWCAEHGYLRRADVTTQKLCSFTGSPLHDGQLNRVAQPADARLGTRVQ